MTTYEPADWRPQTGERAVILTPFAGERQAMRVGSGGWVDTDNLMWSGPGVTHARKLEVVDPASVVVLDPDDPNDVQRFREAAYTYSKDGLVTADSALRSLLPAATPPEPNGLGAVVTGTTADASTATWVRAIKDGGPAKWALSIPDPAGRERWWLWSAMHVTGVLSHGVGCSCGAPDCNGAAALTGETP